jgi:hypothetical protein
MNISRHYAELQAHLIAGLFESTGVRFDNQTWTPGDGARCCIIKLTNRDSD